MQKYKGTLFVILSAIIFGCMPLAAKFFYARGGNPVTLTVLRNGLVLPALWFLMRHGGGDYTMNGERMKKMLLLSLGYVSTPLLLYLSYRYIPSGMATTLHFVYPVFVLLLCVIFFHEPLNRIKLLCMVLCTCGIFMLYTPGQTGSVVGIFLAFASGLTFSFYVVYLDKSGMTALPPFALAFWLTLLSTLESFAVGALSGTLSFCITPSGWIIALLLALGVAIGGAVLFQAGIKSCGAQKAAILSTLEPITSVLIGIAIFREPFSIREGAAIILILTATIVLTLFDREIV